jgi:hypothetical protein
MMVERVRWAERADNFRIPVNRELSEGHISEKPLICPSHIMVGPYVHDICLTRCEIMPPKAIRAALLFEQHVYGNDSATNPKLNA